MDKVKPGDGIKSLKTSHAFKLFNFELYITPNKFVMGFGLAAIISCVGYIAYMRKKYADMGYYSAINKEGEEMFVKKVSKWD